MYLYYCCLSSIVTLCNVFIVRVSLLNRRYSSARTVNEQIQSTLDTFYGDITEGCLFIWRFRKGETVELNTT
jgi:hypothetical protein